MELYESERNWLKAKEGIHKIYMHKPRRRSSNTISTTRRMVWLRLHYDNDLYAGDRKKRNKEVVGGERERGG